jgi:hypothetical protein
LVFMSNPQKIFDILPPERAVKEAVPAKKIIRERFDNNRDKEQRPQTPQVQDKSSNFILRNFFLLGFILVLAFFLISQFVLNKTDVLVYPKNEISSLNGDVNVNTSKTAIDVISKIIPGKIFQAQKTISQDFPATGKTTQGGNATGIIKIYNNFSTAPQILVKNTRLISSGGFLFRTTERVVIPGAALVKGKIQASSLDVNVIADQPGQDYNIGPSTFSIPGFVGTSKYTAFYGKSSSSMSGGFLGQALQVTKADLDNAKNDLSAKALSQGRDLLLTQIGEEFIVLDGAISSGIVDSTSSFSAGAVAKNFNYQVTAKFTALVFKKADLENFSKTAILSAFPSGKNIEDSSLKLSYGFKSLDQNNGKMVLTASSSAKVYSDIDKNRIINELKGQSLLEAQEILSTESEINKAQIKSWPFWANNVSKDAGKIDVQLILDPG